MKKVLMTVVLFLLATGGVFAQGVDAGAPSGTGSDGSLLINTPKGIFALRAGVLAKYDLATLKPVKIFELFGPAPAPPGTDADREKRTAYFAEIQRRNAPAIMVVKGDDLLIVIGDGFARINQDTFKVEATGNLAKPGAPTATSGFRMTREAAPGFLLVKDTLYLFRSTEMLSLNTADGKVLLRSDLPKELQPVQTNFGGGRGPGGGGSGGN